MMRLLTCRWTSSIAGIVAYLVVFALTWMTSPAPPADPPGPELVAAGPSWTFQNAEMDLLMDELRREKETLATRKAELDQLAERLHSERAELIQLTQSVHQIQVEFDQNVTRVRTEEAANLKRLAKTYASMSPDAAVSLMKGLDDSTVAKVLVQMKESQTAALLEVLAKQGASDAKRAAAISERLRLSISDTPKQAPNQ